MRGPATAIVTSVLLGAWLLPVPAFAGAPRSPGTTPSAETTATSADGPAEAAEPAEPPSDDPLLATDPQPDPAPDDAAAVPEPQPQPEPDAAAVQREPTPDPAAAPAPEPFPAAIDDETKPQRSRRALGLGLLVAGSGFVAIGATTAALYGATEKRCGGSCIGGAIAAAAGIAGVAVGAIVLSRSRRDVALRLRARTVARWDPGRGLSF